MTGCRDMSKNTNNAPKMGLFPKEFFQKSDYVTFVALWYPNFMQKIRKTNGQSLRYSKIHGGTEKSDFKRSCWVNPGYKIRYN